jgi:hypothetical protein
MSVPVAGSDLVGIICSVNWNPDAGGRETAGEDLLSKLLPATGAFLLLKSLSDQAHDIKFLDTGERNAAGDALKMPPSSQAPLFLDLRAIGENPWGSVRGMTMH